VLVALRPQALVLRPQPLHLRQRVGSGLPRRDAPAERVDRAASMRCSRPPAAWLRRYSRCRRASSACFRRACACSPAGCARMAVGVRWQVMGRPTARGRAAFGLLAREPVAQPRQCLAQPAHLAPARVRLAARLARRHEPERLRHRRHLRSALARVNPREARPAQRIEPLAAARAVVAGHEVARGQALAAERVADGVHRGPGERIARLVPLREVLVVQRREHAEVVVDPGAAEVAVERLRVVVAGRAPPRAHLADEGGDVGAGVGDEGGVRLGLLARQHLGAGRVVAVG
jgi:hypothetical protein